MKLMNKRHKLTAYGLACGYIREQETNGIRTVGWRENGAYHVRTHNHITMERLAWECPATATELHREFESQVRKYHTPTK